jgi:hypothetical protein
VDRDKRRDNASPPKVLEPGRNSIVVWLVACGGSRTLVGIGKPLVPNDVVTIGERHKAGGIIKAPVAVDNQARVASKHHCGIELIAQRSCKLTGTDVPGDVPPSGRLW